MNSEPNSAVFKEKQLRIGLESGKVYVILEGNRQVLGEVVCEFSSRFI